MPVAAGLKVLVVDDQLSMRQVTRMALEKIGVRLIHEAENGQVALQKAVAQPLDLIISDFNMPEMDGLGLLRAVRGHPDRKSIRLNSSHSQISYAVFCLKKKKKKKKNKKQTKKKKKNTKKKTK